MRNSRHTAITAPVAAPATKAPLASILPTGDDAELFRAHTALVKRAEAWNAPSFYPSDEESDLIGDVNTERNIKLMMRTAKIVAGGELKYCRLMKELRYPVAATEYVNAKWNDIVKDIKLLARKS